MTNRSPKAIAAAALIGAIALALPVPARAGHGDAWGAGLVGFGIGAIIGSALAPREVYVVPPSPPPAYYGPVSYGTPPWTPDWYAYCASRYRSFDPGTGYFMAMTVSPISASNCPADRGCQPCGKRLARPGLHVSRATPPAR